MENNENIPQKPHRCYIYKYKEIMNLCRIRAGLERLSSDDDYTQLMAKIAHDLCIKPDSPTKNININTLKKMNARLKVENRNYIPNIKNLNIIAQFLGCDDWNYLQENMEQTKKFVEDGNPIGTGFVGKKYLRPLVDTLHRNDVIKVYYEPDRVMQARYLGELIFEIIGLKNIPSLDRGDTFMAFNFVKGDVFRLMKVNHKGFQQDFTSNHTHHITKVEVEKAPRPF